MEVLNEFEYYLQERSYSKNTIHSYKVTVRSFIKWVEQVYKDEHFEPGAVVALDIADYRRHLLEKEKKKPATVNHAIDVLTGFFSWAEKRGIIEENPVSGVKRVQEQRNAPRWLNRREVGVLARAGKKYGRLRDRALLMLLLHTGLRVTEAVSLRTTDLVLKDRSGFVRVHQGKGVKYREVPLNITVRKVLLQYLEYLNSEWLFPGRKDGHITARTAEKIMERLGRFAGVEVTPHRLRHTFGKNLIDSGESLDRVAALLGHTNLNTTARYTKPSADDLEKAVEKLAWE